MKHALQTAGYFLIFGLLVTIVVGQTKPAAPTTNPVAPAPQIKTFPVLDSTLLWSKPDGLGIGAQNCPLMHYSSGMVRDFTTGKTISSRLMLEPSLDWEVLAASLKVIPAGGWMVLDGEGAHTYDVHESYAHENNVRGIGRWKAYIQAARAIRPDCKLAVILNWHPCDGANYSIQSNWAECDWCTATFKSDILPLIDALAYEVYLLDYPWANGDRDTISFWGPQGQPALGWAMHAHAYGNWARALTGRAGLPIICVNSYGDPATDGKFLSGPRMKAMLDILAMYDPPAVMLWGIAENSGRKAFADGYSVGTFDPKADWVAEVKRRAK